MPRELCVKKIPNREGGMGTLGSAIPVNSEMLIDSSVDDHCMFSPHALLGELRKALVTLGPSGVGPLCVIICTMVSLLQYFLCIHIITSQEEHFIPSSISYSSPSKRSTTCSAVLDGAL